MSDLDEALFTSPSHRHFIDPLDHLVPHLGRQLRARMNQLKRGTAPPHHASGQSSLVDEEHLIFDLEATDLAELHRVVAVLGLGGP